ncbi:PTS sugar transporter subunit IIA [Fusobacterium sp.]|uniref:PTS sugar transporter subunit IIA n=1 Tax=Fusobacterium sp. TaxID=68766 RepID=UPI0025BAD158|nr:PTS sugar transporter subunit IIA [Fusobacterium sp.]
MKFLMATHGNFAKGIKESIELVLGKFQNLNELSCYTNKEFDLEKEIEKIINGVNGEELIVVTDIYGGSVNNGFLQKLENHKNIHVVSGLNLPLMIELLSEQDSYITARELIMKSLENTKDEIKYCNLEIDKMVEDEEF